jgi:hypothetical protein
MPADNPRQNEHRWWGTLTIDTETTFTGEIKLPKNASGGYQQCVFIKTTRDSHFVSSGTYIKAVRVFADLDEAKKRFDQLVTVPDLDAIKADLDNIESPFCCYPIVEVIEFDYDKSSPLALALKAKTEELFTDTKWRTDNGDKIGREEIERALRL